MLAESTPTTTQQPWFKPLPLVVTLWTYDAVSLYLFVVSRFQYHCGIYILFQIAKVDTRQHKWWVWQWCTLYTSQMLTKTWRGMYNNLVFPSSLYVNSYKQCTSIKNCIKLINIHFFILYSTCCLIPPIIVWFSFQFADKHYKNIFGVLDFVVKKCLNGKQVWL